MKIHEYQAKAILARYGVPVPRGEVAFNATEAGEIARRLGEAQREIACIPGYDYLVVNHLGRLDETVRRIAAIIEAERARVSPRPALS